MNKRPIFGKYTANIGPDKVSHVVEALVRCRTKMKRIRQPRPESGLGFQIPKL